MTTATTPFACEKSVIVPPRPSVAKGPSEQRRPVRRAGPAAAADKKPKPEGGNSAIREKAQDALEKALTGNIEAGNIAIREKAQDALENALLGDSEGDDTAIKEKARDALERALQCSEEGDDTAIKEKARDALERALQCSAEGGDNTIREKAKDALEKALLSNHEASDSSAAKEKVRAAFEKALESAEEAPIATPSPARTPQSGTKSKRRIIGGVIRAPDATATKSVAAVRMDLDSDSDAAGEKAGAKKQRESSLARLYAALGADLHSLDAGEQACKPEFSTCVRSRSSTDLKISLEGAQVQKKKTATKKLNPLLGGMLEASFELALGHSASAMAMDLGLERPKTSAVGSPLQRSASLGALKVTHKQEAAKGGRFPMPSTQWDQWDMGPNISDGISSGSLAWSRRVATSAAKRGLQLATAF
jgi:hypothetical protein